VHDDRTRRIGQLIRLRVGLPATPVPDDAALWPPAPNVPHAGPTWAKSHDSTTEVDSRVKMNDPVL